MDHIAHNVPRSAERTGTEFPCIYTKAAGGVGVGGRWWAVGVGWGGVKVHGTSSVWW